MYLNEVSEALFVRNSIPRCFAVKRHDLFLAIEKSAIQLSGIIELATLILLQILNISKTYKYIDLLEPQVSILSSKVVECLQTGNGTLGSQIWEAKLWIAVQENLISKQ